MKRLAIFVEGQTEQIFIVKLITEIAGEKNIAVVQERKLKGQNYEIIKSQNVTGNTKFFILIRDCKSDSQVKSAVVELAESLTNKGYKKILGIRDVYPNKHSDIPELMKWMTYGVPTKFAPINIFLAIMEIEAWFLAEVTHFEKINSSLTISKIKEILAFDPSTQPVESRYNPSKDLNQVYKSVGMAYNKTERNCIRTVNALDCSSLYLLLPQRIPSLKLFIDEINSFFTL